MKAKRLIAVAGLVGAVAASAHAGPIDAPLFQVNTYTTGFQVDPDIAFLPSGAFVVAWHSDEGGFGDDGFWSIQAQRFARGGLPVGGEFQVNTYTSRTQSGATIAAQPSGEFLVAWISDGSFGDDDRSFSAQARRYGSNGEPVGAEFQVNSYTTGVPFGVDIASIPAQGFVVTWAGRRCPGVDPCERSVQGRRLGLDGSPLGEDFQLSVSTTVEYAVPRVAAWSGGFEVVWQRSAPGEQSSIWRRRFAVDGTALGGDRAASTDAAIDWDDPEIALWPSGAGVVVGRGDLESSSGWRFDASGDPVGSRFALGTDVTGTLTMPALALDADSSFVVAWREPRESAQAAVEAQRFAADGTPAGAEVLVSRELLGVDPTPALAFGPAGELVIVWASNDLGATDGSGSSIQRTRPQIFYDGFESGDGCRWSESLALGDPCG